MCRSIFHTHLRFLYLNISIEYEFIDSFEDFIGRDKAKERRGEVSVGRYIDQFRTINPRREQWIYEYLI